MQKPKLKKLKNKPVGFCFFKIYPQINHHNVLLFTAFSILQRRNWCGLNYERNVSYLNWEFPLQTVLVRTWDWEQRHTCHRFWLEMLRRPLSWGTWWPWAPGWCPWMSPRDSRWSTPWRMSTAHTGIHGWKVKPSTDMQYRAQSLVPNSHRSLAHWAVLDLCRLITTTGGLGEWG